MIREIFTNPIVLISLLPICAILGENEFFVKLNGNVTFFMYLLFAGIQIYGMLLLIIQNCDNEKKELALITERAAFKTS